MTLPASGSISTAQIMAELRVNNSGRAYPLSLGDADVRTLCGVPSGPVSLPGNFYGKSAYTPMVVGLADNSVEVDSDGFGGTVSTNSTCTVSLGSGGYTYSWSVVNNSGGLTITYPTANTVRASFTYGRNTDQNRSATVYCTVSDNTGHSVASRVATLQVVVYDSVPGIS